MTTSRQGPPPGVRELPRPSARLTGLVLLFAGLLGEVASFILAVEKYWLVTNPFYTPSCTLGEAISCGPIMDSWQAEVFGFPNPFIGIAAFAVVGSTGGALLGGARLADWYWRGLQVGAVLGTVFVGWLMYQSMFDIQALCPYCMVVWAVMFVIVWYVSLESVGRLGTQLSPRAGALVGAVMHRHGVVVSGWLVLVAAVVILTTLLR